MRYDRNNPTDQTGSFESTGAHSQWTFAYAGNYNDKVYIGASVGFNRIRYDYNSTLDDQYVNAKVIRSSNHSEDLNVSGSGINATLGVIYKATPELQIGASITSPTFMSIKETFNELVKADIIGIPQTDANGKPVFFVPDVTSVGLQPNDFQYNIQSPLRASGGATYFFGKNGFITGTVEYVGYNGIRLSTSYNDASSNSNFRKNTSDEIKRDNSSGLNFKLGGEYRAGTFRARVGGAYYSDPLVKLRDGIDRSQIYYSGGVGFRSDRFFADVTGIYNTTKSAYSPYSLSNLNDSPSASIKSQSINVLISLGTFF